MDDRLQRGRADSLRETPEDGKVCPEPPALTSGHTGDPSLHLSIYHYYY